MKFLRRVIFREDNIRLLQFYLDLCKINKFFHFSEGCRILVEMFNKGTAKCVDYYVNNNPNIDKEFRSGFSFDYNYTNLFLRCCSMNYIQFVPFFQKLYNSTEMMNMLMGFRKHVHKISEKVWLTRREEMFRSLFKF